MGHHKHEEPSKGSSYIFLRIVYLLWAAFLGYLFFSGRLSYFIAPKFKWLTIFSVVVFTAMALFIKELQKGSVHWKMTVLVIPVIFGAVVFPKGFGPKEALIKAVNLPVLKEEVKTQLLKEPVLVQAPEYEDRDLWEIRIGIKYKRQEIEDKYIKTIGFVHNSGQLKDGFYLLRFYITCCAADATPLSMIVLPRTGVSLKEGQWVKVKGKVKVVEQGKGQVFAVLLASEVKEIPIPPPEDQYMY